MKRYSKIVEDIWYRFEIIFEEFVEESLLPSVDVDFSYNENESDHEYVQYPINTI